MGFPLAKGDERERERVCSILCQGTVCISYPIQICYPWILITLQFLLLHVLREWWVSMSLSRGSIREAYSCIGQSGLAGIALIRLLPGLAYSVANHVQELQAWNFCHPPPQHGYIYLPSVFLFSHHLSITKQPWSSFTGTGCWLWIIFARGAPPCRQGMSCMGLKMVPWQPGNPALQGKPRIWERGLGLSWESVHGVGGTRSIPPS